MTQKLYQLCAALVPGDTHRNLRIEPEYSEQTFKHILVPLWLLTYDYGTQNYQVAVNGYTGKIAGNYPKSFWKIFFLIVFILAVLVAFFILSN